MTPVIQNLPPKKLVGRHVKMSLAENKTPELWRSFMPLRKEIKNKLGQDLFSLQVYSPSFDLKNFSPHATFEKWALVEVNDFNAVPEGMEAFTLEGGRYAVFNYKGPASDGERVFRYIFETWLPSSEYELDQRPHFEVLGEKYKNDELDSEEEIWIPVKLKAK